MRSRFWLVFSAMFLCVYLGYILWAKFAKVLGTPPIKIGDVGEFLMFFTSVAAFTLGIMTTRQPASIDGSAEDGGDA